MKKLLIGLLGCCACSVVLAKETPATPTSLTPVGIAASCLNTDTLLQCASRVGNSPYTLVSGGCTPIKASFGCLVVRIGIGSGLASCQYSGGITKNLAETTSLNGTCAASINSSFLSSTGGSAIAEIPKD